MKQLSRRTLARFYDAEAHRPIDSRTSHLMWYRFRTMINMIHGQNLTIVDIGAGDGDVVVELTKRGHRCHAVDISEARLKKYRSVAKEYNIGQIHGNIEQKIPLPKESVDVVLCGEVLEHVPNNDKALKSITRILKPGGQLIVSVPFNEILKMISCPHCGKQHELNGHLHSYDQTSLRELFERHQFTVVASHRGHTKVSRELWNRWHTASSLRFCHLIDRMTPPILLASDTWIMMKGIKAW